MSSTELYYSTLGSDPDISDLVEMFVASMQRRVKQLEIGLADRDWACLHRVAHQIKGAAGSYGFPQLTPTLSVLEVLAQNQADPAEIALVLASIREMSGRMRSGAPEGCEERAGTGRSGDDVMSLPVPHPLVPRDLPEWK